MVQTIEQRVRALMPDNTPEPLTELDHRAIATVIPPLPAGEVDGMVLTHKTFPVVKYFGHTVEYPHRFDVLAEDGRVWMSSVPQEFKHIVELLDALPETGRIFMSGLGLGVALRMGGDRIKHAKVVERDPRVVELVWPHIKRDGWELHLSDIEEWLTTYAQAYAGQFDIVYLDTWDSGDSFHLGWINKLRRLAEPMLAPGGTTVLWSYEYMLAELRSTLLFVGQSIQQGLITYKRDRGLKEFGQLWPPLVPFARWCLRKRRTDDELRAEIEREVGRWCEGAREGLTQRT